MKRRSDRGPLSKWREVIQIQPGRLHQMESKVTSDAPSEAERLEGGTGKNLRGGMTGGGGGGDREEQEEERCGQKQPLQFKRSAEMRRQEDEREQRRRERK